MKDRRTLETKQKHLEQLQQALAGIMVAKEHVILAADTLCKSGWNTNRMDEQITHLHDEFVKALKQAEKVVAEHEVFELVDCWRCGSENTLMMNSGDSHYVRCLDCGLIDTPSTTKQEAIDKWNGVA